MAAICDAAIHLCATRVTRLDSLGNPVAGPNNVYVTANAMTLTVTPVIEAGEDKTLVSGCDCIVAEYHGYDKLKYFNLELDLGIVEPGLIEMLTGAAIRVDGSGNPIGVDWPSQIQCPTTQPNVCIEGWQTMWNDDHAETSATYQYLRHVFPSSRWEIAAYTLQNDFYTPKLTAYTRSNPLWGTGIFHDVTQAIGAMGSMFYDAPANFPTTKCGYQSFAIT